MRFVILAMSRVGSYMVASALNAHPDVTCFGELLKKNDLTPIDFLDLPGMSEGFEKLREQRLADPLSFLNHAYELGETRTRAVGFKLMLGQNPDTRDYFLSNPDYPVILLYRNNLLATYASQQVARETSQGVAMEGEVVRQAKIEFVPKEFDRLQRRRERLYTEARDRLAAFPDRKVCEIEYLEAADGSGIARALELLEVPVASLPQPTTQKRAKGQLIDRFSNPEAVHAYLEEHERTHWLAPELAGQS